jgi:hypothetical protein
MAVIDNLQYFLILFGGALFIILIWMVIRRLCYMCGMGGAGDVSLTPDSAADSDVESQPDDDLVNTNQSRHGWLQSWASRRHRPQSSTTRIMQTLFHIDAAEHTAWKDPQSTSTTEYIAVPARMAPSLGNVELKRGTYVGDGAKHYGQINRASKVYKPQLSPDSHSPPRILLTDMLRSDNTGVAMLTTGRDRIIRSKAQPSPARGALQRPNSTQWSVAPTEASVVYPSLHAAQADTTLSSVTSGSTVTTTFVPFTPDQESIPQQRQPTVESRLCNTFTIEADDSNSEAERAVSPGQEHTQTVPIAPMIGTERVEER